MAAKQLSMAMIPYSIWIIKIYFNKTLTVHLIYSFADRNSLMILTLSLTYIPTDWYTLSNAMNQGYGRLDEQILGEEIWVWWMSWGPAMCKQWVRLFDSEGEKRSWSDNLVRGIKTVHMEVSKLPINDPPTAGLHSLQSNIYSHKQTREDKTKQM